MRYPLDAETVIDEESALEGAKRRIAEWWAEMRTECSRLMGEPKTPLPQTVRELQLRIQEGRKRYPPGIGFMILSLEDDVIMILRQNPDPNGPLPKELKPKLRRYIALLEPRDY